MRTIITLTLALLLLGSCKARIKTTTTNDTTTTTATAPARDKTTAEKAFDAGDHARRRALELKKGEDEKAKETDAAGDNQ